MGAYDEDTDLEVTEDQMVALRELGISDQEIRDMSMSEATALLAQLLAEREGGR